MFGMKSKKLMGMHITDTHVNLIGIIKAGKFQYEVEQIHTISLQPGWIKGGKIMNEDVLAQSIADSVKRFKLQGCPVHLTIPTSSVLLRKSVYPVLRNKELRNLIDVDLYSGSQLPFKNPVFDYIRLDRTNGRNKAKEEEVLIVATQEDMVNSYTRLAEKVGLIPKSVEISCLSLYRILIKHINYQHATLPERYMMIHLDHDYVDLCIMENGVPCFVRSVGAPSQNNLDSTEGMYEMYGRNICIDMNRILNYYKYSISPTQSDIEHFYVFGEQNLADTILEHGSRTFPGVMNYVPTSSILTQQDPLYNAHAVLLGLALKGA
jgi:type IV pilus assembly protein PilM